MRKTEDDEKENTLITEAHKKVNDLIFCIEDYFRDLGDEETLKTLGKDFIQFKVRNSQPSTFSTKENRQMIVNDLVNWCKKNKIPVSSDSSSM